MDEGAKELGKIVLAVVVVLALIAIATKIIGGDALEEKIEGELDKVTSYVIPAEAETELGDEVIVRNA